jgi:hypothetical protein
MEDSGCSGTAPINEHDAPVFSSMEKNMTHLLKTLAARHEEREAHRLLQKELSAFSSPADRLEIETIVDRYSDEEAHEVREILVLQSV